jgi:hypothetical protein
MKKARSNPDRGPKAGRKPTAENKAGPPGAAAQARLLFVDAIEGERARLLLGVDAFDVPARLLPRGAKEGSWLRPSFDLVPAPPDSGAALRRRLGAGDDGGDIKL